MQHAKRLFVLSLVAVSLSWVVFPSAAVANPLINVQTFRPSPHLGDFIQVQGSQVPQEGVWSAGLFFHIGKNPLAFQSGERRWELIQDQMTIEAMGTYSLFGWVDIGLAVPVHVINQGQTKNPNDATGDERIDSHGAQAFGDIRLSPKIKLLERSESTLGFGVALSSLFVLPTGDPDGFVSDGFSWQPSLIVDFETHGLNLGVNVGARLRGISRTEQFPSLVGGHEIHAGLGASYRIVGEERAAVEMMGFEMSLIAEASGSVGIYDIDNPYNFDNTSRLEGSFAAQLHFPDAGAYATLGGGSGWLSGYGNVKYRIFANITLSEPVERDRDKDGIMDNSDQCPRQPEDFDQFQDNDGCPDNDNDKDLIADRIDRCPNDPEDMDGFEDSDGCPDLDNDGDAIPDDNDECPTEPEDIDNYQDKDGCPDKDNDGDGLPDVADQCPDKKETVNGFQDDDGCPDESLARVEAGRIVILDRIFFETKKAEIKPQSYPVLNAVAGILKVTPDAKKVRVAGHTDDKGSDKKNMALSTARAQAVMAFLIEAGIPEARLEAVGFGESQPAAEGKSDAARDKNRRVEFIILD